MKPIHNSQLFPTQAKGLGLSQTRLLLLSPSPLCPEQPWKGNEVGGAGERNLKESPDQAGHLSISRLVWRVC